jgi:hypothetical protein
MTTSTAGPGPAGHPGHDARTAATGFLADAAADLRRALSLGAVGDRPGTVPVPPTGAG